MPLAGESKAWPPDAEPFYRPALLAAMASCFFGIVGSLGPWAGVLMFTINGLDASWWGVATLTMSALSGLALIGILFWDKTSLDARYSVPLAWLVVVFAVGCVAIAWPFLLRILTTPGGEAFGISIGPSIGWGLWLLSLAGVVQIGTAITVAVQLGKAADRLAPAPEISWTETVSAKSWATIAGICAALIAILSVAHFASHWSYSSGTAAPTGPAHPSFTMPQLPSASAPTREVVTPSRDALPRPSPRSAELVAATAAEQEKMDRRMARDFAGEWRFFTKVLREGLSQDAFVQYNERCTPEGFVPITATGVQMDADGRASVRIETSWGASKIRTMSLEDGSWYQVPDDFLLTNLGKTGDELIAAAKALGQCVVG